MPPKKEVAAKGVKGKAKAAAKEEKKQQKIAKTQSKGKLFDHLFPPLLACITLFMSQYIENL